jgi:hypothetical protein
MEEFKSLEELTKMDPQHLLHNDQGRALSLEDMHDRLSKDILNVRVPNEIKDQFNIIKNMALYSFFCASLSTEVQQKTYSLIEYALRLKIQPKKPMMFKALMQHALNEQWISDKGFRHVKIESVDNQACKAMIRQFPTLQTLSELGSHIVMSNDRCLEHVAICCDFINQIYTINTHTQPEQSTFFNKTEFTDQPHHVD